MSESSSMTADRSRLLLEQLITQWREREGMLYRKADAQYVTQYAGRLAAEAEGIARCAAGGGIQVISAAEFLIKSGPELGY